MAKYNEHKSRSVYDEQERRKVLTAERLAHEHEISTIPISSFWRQTTWDNLKHQFYLIRKGLTA